MANRPTRIGTQTSDVNGTTPTLSLSNLEEYFKILETEVSKLTKAQKDSLVAIKKLEQKSNDDLEKARFEAKQQHIKDLAKMEGELALDNLKLTQEMKETFEEAQAAKDRTEDNKRIAEYFKKVSKQNAQQRKDEEARSKREKELAQEEAGLGVIGKGGSVVDGFKYLDHQLRAGLSNALDSTGMSKLGTDKLAKAMEKLTAGINSAMEKYASYHARVDTRLQGSYYNVGVLGSSFDKLASNLGIVSASGLLSTEELYENLNTLVDAGIVTNLEQRAFFGTIKDTVATTFDVNSRALNRIIRLQQDDSTAIRLGMESYLTRFLNEFVESTDYLTSTFDTVAESLLEASSLMSKNQSAEFEYIVQKWLGTLTGLGLSDSTSQNIASAIGQLASGNISSLSGSDMQNLIVMAASKAGLSYADMLTNGMDAIDANELLLGIVKYMQELGSYSSNVVKSELARTFGVTVSDIVAAQNMTDKDLKTAYKSIMSANNMTTELIYQLGQTGSRLGISKILSNLYKNVEYSTGISIAKNPALYALWKITDFIGEATKGEGIRIPAFSVMGNMVNLQTTVDALLKGGIAGIGMLSNIGGIISGLASTVTGSGNVLWAALEASTTIGNAIGKAKRGLGYNTGFYSNGTKGLSRRSGASSSVTSYSGNYSGDDYGDSALNDANDDADKTMDQKKKEEEDPITGYLKDMEFADKMEQISEDIHSLKSEGVVVSNMPTSLTPNAGGIAGWTLGV